ETRAHVGERDEAVVVPNVDTERALLDAYSALPAVVRRATEAVLVHAILARKVVAVGLRILRILEVEHLHSVFIRGHEHVGPANFMIVRQVAPVGRPSTDRK